MIYKVAIDKYNYLKFNELIQIHKDLDYMLKRYTCISILNKKEIIQTNIFHTEHSSPDYKFIFNNGDSCNLNVFTGGEIFYLAEKESDLLQIKTKK